MPYYKKLVGKKCYLSPVSMDDAEKWTAWDNDPEVTIPLGGESHEPYSLEKSREILEDCIKKQSQIFSIVDLATEECIGRCMLVNIDQIDRRATLGISIGEKSFWGKGYGQEASLLLLDYGFNLLNLNNIMLGTYAYNARAIHCYQKIGFKEIGRVRQGKIIGGKKYDIIEMDMLAEEFNSIYVNSLIEQS